MESDWVKLRSLDYKWLVAIVFVSGLFMDIMDSTIVNVALPTLGREFSATTTTLEWVITAYLLSLAVWIPASGWVGDKFGTKKVFLFALAIGAELVVVSAAILLAVKLVPSWTSSTSISTTLSAPSASR